MVGEDESPRRRDVLRTGAAAGLLGFAGLTMNGASAQETTTEQETTTAEAGVQQVQGAFSFSLQQGDRFRVRFRPRDPAGNPATETVPAGCLDGDQPQEYQLVIVRAFRDGRNLGFRGLLVPMRALAEDMLGTTTAPETTEAADVTALETTTTPEGGQTTMPGGGLPEIELGEWYRATSSEQCDGLYRLGLETAEQPETTPGGTQTTTP